MDASQKHCYTIIEFRLTRALGFASIRHGDSRIRGRVVSAGREQTIEVRFPTTFLSLVLNSGNGPPPLVLVLTPCAGGPRRSRMRLEQPLRADEGVTQSAPPVVQSAAACDDLSVVMSGYDAEQVDAAFAGLLEEARPFGFTVLGCPIAVAAFYYHLPCGVVGCMLLFLSGGPFLLRAANL